MTSSNRKNLRGWANKNKVKVGDKLPGFLHDIKNKWFCFNGNVPHMTMPYFNGVRFSLVYYTTKGFEAMQPEVRGKLENLSFSLPSA